MAKRGRPPKATLTPPDGPALFKRDENGLLENVDYIFNDDGSVDWRAMIGEEHLFPNKSWFEARGKDAPSSSNGLKDYQLLIKLSGIKELARLRGFRDVSYTINRCDSNHVTVTCKIEFCPNYETNGEAVSFQDMANATLDNTSNFATKFLETIACNRAFVRCVRNFLNVHIVGDDEIDKSGSAPITAQANSNVITPHGILEQKFEDFNGLKDFLRELWQQKLYRNESVKEWVGFEDIPPKEARILLKLAKSAAE